MQNACTLQTNETISQQSYLLRLFDGVDTRFCLYVLRRPVGGLPLSRCFCECSWCFILYILVVLVLQQSFREKCTSIRIVMKCLCGCRLVTFVRILFSLHSILLLITSFTRKQSVMMSFSWMVLIPVSKQYVAFPVNNNACCSFEVIKL